MIEKLKFKIPWKNYYNSSLTIENMELVVRISEKNNDELF